MASTHVVAMATSASSSAGSPTVVDVRPYRSAKRRPHRAGMTTKQPGGPEQRASRRVGYVVAAVVNGVLLWVVNNHGEILHG